MNLYDIHFFYNFIIQIKKYDTPNISTKEGPKVSTVYPVDLNFHYEDSFNSFIIELMIRKNYLD